MISLASVVLLASTAATSEPELGKHSTMFLPGVLFSAGNQGTSFGTELSVSHWFDHNVPTLIGAYAQGELGTRSNRVGAGIELGYWLIGAELGWSHRFDGHQGDRHLATHAVQFAPYLGLGFGSLGIRFTQPLGNDEGMWGREVAFVLTVKYMTVISGRHPNPITTEGTPPPGPR